MKVPCAVAIGNRIRDACTSSARSLPSTDMGNGTRVIGFDADDTLWHNETIFEAVHARYRALLSEYHDADTVEKTLFATEMRNLELYGYGVKGFALSAVETAIALTNGRIRATEIQEILDLGKRMLDHPVELLEGVSEVLHQLRLEYHLLLITKGDLRDQERKVRKSGLGDCFRGVEIVSEKNDATYAALLRRHAIEPSDFIMVGNSMKSDILPILALGGAAIHIPYHLTWEYERVTTKPEAAGRFFEAATIRDVPGVLRRWR